MRHDVDVAHQLLDHLQDGYWLLGPGLEQIELMLVKVETAIDKAAAELAELSWPA